MMNDDDVDLSSLAKHKWILNTVMTIGGILIGLGAADCLSAFTLNQFNIDQIARGLTIFGAGLTIVVVVDNTKTQRNTDQMHQETQQQLKRVERELDEIKKLLHKE